MLICEKSKCTGCQACMNVCPKQAITFVEDERGFVYPSVSNVCVECGVCQKVCPQVSGRALNDSEPEVWASFTKDRDVRKSSSSGGMFTEFAYHFLNNGGLVFAAKFDKDYKNVVYDCCNSKDRLKEFRGSKYVQSSPGFIYRDVKAALTSGEQVMFVGVPCQVDGLKKYLGREYENLTLVDIICHGVPSPKLWRDYSDMLEKEMNSRVVAASFRYKKPNWTRFSLRVDFENGTSFVKSKFDDPYLIAFLKEFSMRENCHSCAYTSTRRTGDITLADFWGFHSDSFRMRNTDKGISLVLLNTEKGKKLFEEIKNNCMTQQRTMHEAIEGNRSLKTAWKKNPQSDDFWNEYLHGDGLDSALQKFCKPYKYPAKTYLSWFMLNHMYMIPKPILTLRKNIRGGVSDKHNYPHFALDICAASNRMEVCA